MDTVARLTRCRESVDECHDRDFDSGVRLVSETVVVRLQESEEDGAVTMEAVLVVVEPSIGVAVLVNDADCMLLDSVDEKNDRANETVRVGGLPFDCRSGC